MYAVVELQWHQYILEEGMEIVVNNMDIAQSQKFVTEKVLAVFDDAASQVKVWKPFVDGASVEFEVWETRKWEKVRILKFKRKTRYSRLKGFRPLQTVLTVKKIAL